MPNYPALRLLTTLAVVAGLAGCVQQHVIVKEPQRGTELQTHHVNSFFWGATREDVIAENCVSNAMAEVRYRQNTGQLLASFLTLGIWIPAEVQWYCAKPPVPSEGTITLPNDDTGGPGN